MLEKNKQ
jgi:hypothetical protein